MPLSADNLVEHTVASYVNGVSQQADALRLESRVERQLNCLSNTVRGVLRRPGMRLRSELRNRLVPAPGPALVDEQVPEDFWAVGLPDERPIIRFASTGLGYRHRLFTNPNLTSSVPGPHPHEATSAPIIQFQLPEEFEEEITERSSRAVLIAVGRFTADHSLTLNTTQLYLLPWDAQDGVLGDFVGPALREGFLSGLFPSTRKPRKDLRVSLHGPSAFRNHYEDEEVPFHGGPWVTSLGVGVTVVDKTRAIFPDESDLVDTPDHEVERFSDLPAASSFPEERWAVIGGFDPENPTNEGIGQWFVLAPPSANIWLEWSDLREDDGYDLRSLFGVGGVFQAGLLPEEHPDSDLNSLVVRWNNIAIEVDTLLKYRREAGDRRSNPLSGLAGSNLVDILFLANRAWLLGRDGLQVSETFRPYQWFQTTMLGFPASDPFFVQASAGQSQLVAITQLEGRVLVFGSTPGYVGEVVGAPSGEFTARDSNIRTRGAWEITERGLVFPAGQEVYGVTEDPSSSGLFRFFFKDIDLLDAVEETAHISSFLPKDVVHITGSNLHRIVVLWSPRTPSKVYVFQWDIQQQTRTQASWHEWDLGIEHEILGLDVVESDLYLLLEAAEHPDIPNRQRRLVVSIDITGKAITSPTNKREIHLDKWFLSTPEYVAAQDRTILPWKSFADGVTGPAEEAYHTCRSPEDRSPPFYGTETILAYKFEESWGTADGDEVTGVSFAAFGAEISEGTVSIPGNQSTGRFMVGVAFESEMILSQPFIREQKETGAVSIQEGSLSMKDYTLGFTATRKVRLEELREKDSVVVNFRNVDEAEDQKRVSLPLQGKNVDSRVRIKSVRGEHFNLVNGTWRGHFTSTARRV